MRVSTAGLLLLTLTACGGGSKTATFSCPNGPEIAVAYSEDVATISFADGRTEVVPLDPTREGVYAKSGFSWSETAFRTGRLNDGTRSYSCDQSSIR